MLLPREEGQGVVEYIAILVVVFAFAGVVIVMAGGPVIAKLFSFIEMLK